MLLKNFSNTTKHLLKAKQACLGSLHHPQVLKASLFQEAKKKQNMIGLFFLSKSYFSTQKSLVQTNCLKDLRLVKNQFPSQCLMIHAKVLTSFLNCTDISLLSIEQAKEIDKSLTSVAVGLTQKGQNNQALEYYHQIVELSKITGRTEFDICLDFWDTPQRKFWFNRTIAAYSKEGPEYFQRSEKSEVDFYLEVLELCPLKDGEFWLEKATDAAKAAANANKGNYRYFKGERDDTRIKVARVFFELSRGEIGKAHEAADRILPFLEKQSDRYELGEAIKIYKGFSSAYLKKYDIGNAYKYYKKAKNVKIPAWWEDPYWDL